MQKKGLMVHSLRKPWSLLVPPHPPLQATQEYGGGGLWKMDKTLTLSPPLTLSMVGGGGGQWPWLHPSAPRFNASDRPWAPKASPSIQGDGEEDGLAVVGAGSFPCPLPPSCPAPQV